jgi:AmmeMemoRadiSam system protein B
MSQRTKSPLVRPSCVAGTFYPADVSALRRELVRLFPADDNPPESWRAGIIPHAGWTYSGHVAAAVLGQIEAPESIVIFCPKHRPEGAEWAVAPYERWLIPGGAVAGDRELAEDLAATVRGLEMDERPHAAEHAIEVQLPLIAHQWPAARVVGITIGRADLESCRHFADDLAQVMRRRAPQPLLLVSSDMNHFGTDAENRRLDALAIDALARLDPELLYTTCRDNRITMCGVLPAVIVLETLRRLGGLNECRRVAYATSADANGDTSRVVGYAGLLFR